MADKFEIGEIAILQNCGPAHNGRECVVIGPLVQRLAYIKPFNRSEIFTMLCYEVEIDAKVRLVPPKQLRKKKPPQDDIDSDENVNLKTSWKNCIWKPSEITENSTV